MPPVVLRYSNHVQSCYNKSGSQYDNQYNTGYYDNGQYNNGSQYNGQYGYNGRYSNGQYTNGRWYRNNNNTACDRDDRSRRAQNDRNQRGH